MTSTKQPQPNGDVKIQQKPSDDDADEFSKYDSDSDNSDDLEFATERCYYCIESQREYYICS